MHLNKENIVCITKYKYINSSFKSNENIQKKEGGPDRSVSNNKKIMRVFMVLPMVPMVYQYRSRLYVWYHW